MNAIITIADAEVLRHNFVVTHRFNFQQEQIERQLVAVVTFPRNDAIISRPSYRSVVVERVQNNEIMRAVSCTLYRLRRIGREVPSNVYGKREARHMNSAWCLISYDLHPTALVSSHLNTEEVGR